MISLPSLKNIPTLSGKRVFVRVDFNVSMKDGFRIADDTRIVEAMPTITYLKNNGAKIMLLSHFGRPKGKVDAAFSLKKILSHVEKHVGAKVRFIEEFWKREALE